MSQTARCVFCGQPGTSEEHVFARWIARLIEEVAPGGSFKLHREKGRDKTNMRDLGLTTRAACSTCNNEWMSTFEKSAKPLLKPIFLGESTRWESASEKTRVARWIFKTGLMVDRASQPKDRTVPASEFRYLYEHRTPPLSVSIYLAHYVPDPGEVAWAAWTRSSWASSTSAGGDEYSGYRLTFTVGNAVFHAYGHIGSDDNRMFYIPIILADGKPLDDVVRLLWPLSSTPHEWPPLGAHFNTSGLDLLEPPEEQT